MKKQAFLAAAGGILVLIAGAFFLLNPEEGSNIFRTDVVCPADKTTGECYRFYNQKGLDAYVAENYERAIESFLKAEEQYDNSPVRAFDVMRSRGNSLMALERYDDAREVFTTLAQTSHPDVKKIHGDLIRLYEMQQNYSQAYLVAVKAYELFEDPAFLYEQADQLEEMEEYEKEVAIYEQLLELLPESKDAIQFKIDRLKRAHNL